MNKQQIAKALAELLTDEQWERMYGWLTPPGAPLMESRPRWPQITESSLQRDGTIIERTTEYHNLRPTTKDVPIERLFDIGMAADGLVYIEGDPKVVEAREVSEEECGIYAWAVEFRLKTIRNLVETRLLDKLS